MVFNLRNTIILFSLVTIILMGSLTIYSVTSIDNAREWIKHDPTLKITHQGRYSTTGPGGIGLKCYGKIKVPITIRGITRDISMLVIEKCVAGILIGRDWLKMHKAHINLEDDVLVINSIKVDLVQITPVEECAIAAHKCCKKGVLATINNVEVETSKQGEPREELKEWSCNACYKTLTSMIQSLGPVTREKIPVMRSCVWIVPKQNFIEITYILYTTLVKISSEKYLKLKYAQHVEGVVGLPGNILLALQRRREDQWMNSSEMRKRWKSSNCVRSVQMI